MRWWALLVCLLVLFSGERAYAQRTGPGLFEGPSVCSDVSGQVASQTYCLDYSSGALYVWTGSRWQPISGNGTGSFATGTSISLTNTSPAVGAQAYFLAQNGSGISYFGIKGTGATVAAAGLPANSAFFAGGGGSSGTYYGSDQSGAQLNFYSDGLFSAGVLGLNEDSGGDFFWDPPANLEFYTNRNSALDVIVQNINAGGATQAGYFVSNSGGIVGGFAGLGTGWTPGGPPYNANETYLNGDTAAGLLLFAGAGALHLAASGAPFTLDMTADGSGDFNFASNATATNQGIITFQTNDVVRALSENNAATDVFQVLAQNLTQGVSIGWSYIHEIGSCGNCSLSLDSENGGQLLLQNAVPGSSIVGYGPVVFVNNWHFYAQANGVNPSLASCPNGVISSGSSDTAGAVSYVAGGVSTCLINFARGYGTPPVCTCNVVQEFSPSVIIGRCYATTNTSQVQLNYDSGPQNNTAGATWHCIGDG